MPEESSTNCAEQKQSCCGGCEKPALWGRRDLITAMSWTALLSSGAAVSMGLLRFMFPKVLFEPSLIFKAGQPSEYAIGAVDTRWVKDQRVWLVRESNKMYAVSAICTHLGCTPVWLNNEDKFKCPCHGSGFYRTGLNYEGPAPRALERLKISVGEDGQIVVDRGKKFLLEKNEWDNPESYIVV